MKRAAFALLGMMTTLASSTLFATSGGIFNLSGERAASTCRNCHGAAAPAPEIVVDGLPASGVFALPGDSLLLTVTVRKGVDSEGVAAGFGIATTSAGIFTVEAASGVGLSQRPGVDNEASHTAPRPYVDGASAWQLALTDLREGRHTIFVAANDVNGDSAETGDHVGTIRVPLLVCDPAADRDNDTVPDGCDNCPDVASLDQTDGDEDGIGDACDNCVAVRNADQQDLDDDDVGDVCDDVVDECALGLADCDDLATCTDTAGIGFSCTCPAGFVGTTICIDVDECADGSDDCDDLATCANTAGSFTCTCPAGYDGDGTACADVDECADGTDDCDDLAVCDNTAGSFTCACDAGYVGDGTACSDVDECADGSDDCGEHSVCVNSPGAWTCPCEPGFTDGNVRCVDVDECAGGTDDCGADEACENTEGGFDCACVEGFARNSDDVCVKDADPVDPPVDSCGSCAAGSGAPLGLALLSLLRRRRRRLSSAR